MNYQRGKNPVKMFPSIIVGLTSVGLLYPATITPIRYEENYGCDMDMIGRDMYRAEAILKHGTQEKFKS